MFETLAVREAIKVAIWMNLSNMILEINSQVAILSFMSKILVSKQIFNLIEDIASLTRNIRNSDSHTQHR